MRVRIGPYKNWFGPYQLAEKLCFWAKEEEDEYGFPKTADWVYRFGTWLAYGTTEPDHSKLKTQEKPTALHRFLLWVDSHRSRKIKVHIDHWDTWSMDHTLGLIVLPMLKQLKATKHGSPHVDDEDVPEHLRSTAAPPKENEWDIDANHHDRWDWVMDEMIFAFEHHLNDAWEEQYRSGEIDWDSVPCEWHDNGKPKMYRMEHGPNHTYQCDYDGMQLVKDRITNGFRLFGKYYQALWD